MTRVLGIDLGLKRTGLAVSDELGITVRALSNLVPKSRQEDVLQILTLCDELGIGIVVVGYALLPSGDEGMMAKRARGFRDALQSAAEESGRKLIVKLVEETLTSKNAAKRLVSAGIAKNKRRLRLDGEVACMLVEEFLASRPIGS